MSEPPLELTPLSGRQIFMTRCIACHQPDGSGIPGICPPLANSPRLTGNPEDLIRIMLLGMKGPIVREGTAYNSIMPA
ncbi:MAG: c-type cytochrome, partial [Terrimicrobiaceae bacterium]